MRLWQTTYGMMEGCVEYEQVPRLRRWARRLAGRPPANMRVSINLDTSELLYGLDKLQQSILTLHLNMRLAGAFGPRNPWQQVAWWR